MSDGATHIIVEVHCDRPAWAEMHWEEKYRDSRYRLYVDDDLITERTWIWNNSTFLQENLWVNIDPLATHTLKLESVTHIPEQAKFSLESPLIDGGNLIVTSTNPTEISFKIA
jgi:hypothetical protein